MDNSVFYKALMNMLGGYSSPRDNTSVASRGLAESPVNMYTPLTNMILSQMVSSNSKSMPTRVIGEQPHYRASFEPGERDFRKILPDFINPLGIPSPSHSIHATTTDSSDVIAEIPHLMQYEKDRSSANALYDRNYDSIVNGTITPEISAYYGGDNRLLSAWKNTTPEFRKEEMYKIPGTMEYEAHKKMQPNVQDEFMQKYQQMYNSTYGQLLR